jgi:ABC-2 type transport system ATP-binding protein
VRSPQQEQLRTALTDAGIQVSDDADALTVTGASAEVIGDLASRNGITLHELSPQRASLEEAYLQLTDAVTDYRSAS